MKSLHKYLNTKSQWKMPINSFPETPKYSDIEIFLLSHEFKKYDLHSGHSSGETSIGYADWSKMTNRRFGITDFGQFIEICICERGQINSNNPMYTVVATRDGEEKLAGGNGNKYCLKIETYTTVYEFISTYKEAKEKLNEFFSW